MIRLLLPVLTLTASLALMKIGIDVWNHRQIPASWITDPTSFKVAALISAAILLPAALGAFLSCIALVQLLATRRSKG